MNKLPITIALLVILSLFATADLYINKIDLKTQASQPNNTGNREEEIIEVEKPVVQKIQINQVLQSYQVQEQFQVNQIFKKIELEGLKNLSTFRNKLLKVDFAQSLYIYEIIGPKDQGELTYLNTKLELLGQINNSSETINETNTFGQNSLFYNDQNYPDTAFLLVHIADNLYGFEYEKSGDTYEDVKKLIEYLNTSN